MKRIFPWIRVFGLCVTLWMVACTGNLHAQQPDQSAEEQPRAEEGQILQPKSVSPSFYERGSSGTGLAWAVYLFLIMVAVLAVLWIYQRKGGLPVKRLGASGSLKILETKALGNRQFLVVVEYGPQKMLLGVAPGVINHLCYLDDGSSEPVPEFDSPPEIH